MHLGTWCTAAAVAATAALGGHAAAAAPPATLAERPVADSSAAQPQERAEQTERFSRRVRLGTTGSVTVANVSGDVTVTAGPGDDVVIDAVKRTRGERADLDTARIEVEEAAGRVDVRVDYDNAGGQRRRRAYVVVDFTVTVPAGASVEVRSVSGDARVSNVKGVVRAETVSGNVGILGSPRAEAAKTVSGNVDVSGVAGEGELSLSSVSGDLRAQGIRTRTLLLTTVSGDIVVTDGACDRLEAKSVSGDLEFSGTLARSGRYEIASHSGDVRLSLSGATGFELSANSFSGDVRSDWPGSLNSSSQVGGGRRSSRARQSLRSTVGDASAVLSIRTFSGDIAILRP